MLDLYKITNATVDPIDELLKAAVRLNWYKVQAAIEGWDISFSVDASSGCVAVSVERSLWPSPDEEQAA